MSSAAAQIISADQFIRNNPIFQPFWYEVAEQLADIRDRPENPAPRTVMGTPPNVRSESTAVHRQPAAGPTPCALLSPHQQPAQPADTIQEPKTMRQKLTLGTLKDLDFGKAESAFQAELDKVVADVQDRPNDPTNRSVTLTVLVKPEQVEHGTAETCQVQLQIRSKVPHRQTREYSMKTSTAAELVFNSEAPENANQMTLDELGQNKEQGSL